MQAGRTAAFAGFGRTMASLQSVRILSNKRQGFPRQRMTDRHISTYWKICSLRDHRRKPEVFDELKIKLDWIKKSFYKHQRTKEWEAAVCPARCQ